MFVALTETPGAGKSSVGRALDARGYVVLDLDAIARRDGFVVGRDCFRQTDEVDVEAQRKALRVPAKMVFLTSHYSHRMDVNLAIVLPCWPSELSRRLEARGWPKEKVRENVEAEAVDVILQEAVERLPFVYEVDTTGRDVAETVRAVLEILQGRTKGHEPGAVDWSDEVLSWY